MAKLDRYPEAENLFVNEGMTLTQISKEVKVSSRTLQEWAKKGDWGKKRAELMDVTTGSDVISHRLHKKLLKRLEARIDAGTALTDEEVKNEVRILAITASSLMKIKAYESETKPTAQSGEDKPKEMASAVKDALRKLGISDTEVFDA